MINFKDKKILVTGASSGIGRQIAVRLSELGASVALVARDEARLKQTLSMMREPAKHKIFAYDLQDIEGIVQLVSDCVKFDGVKFNGCVHAAGVPSIYPFKLLDHATNEKIFKINAFSGLEIVKQLSKKQNSDDGASVVFFSSIVTKMFLKGQIAYIISKASLDAIAKPLSLELVKRKMRINTVIVGGVLTQMVKDTQIFRDLKNDEKDPYTTSDICRLLEPQEVANTAIFLLSDAARYIVGENYFIDGGNFR